MQAAHEAILAGGALVLLAIFAGLIGARAKTPLLLIFLGLGMLAGEDGPGGIVFDDFRLTYLLGSIALVVILFSGGLETSAAKLRAAGWPALLLATLGTLVSAGIVGAAGVYLTGATWPAGLLLGAMMAPTDAAAVGSVLRASRLVLPKRIDAVLEIESGLNDPVSVFMTLLLVQMLLPAGTPGHSPGHAPGEAAAWGAASLLFAREMLGGAAFGLVGGFAMATLLRRLTAPDSLYPALLLAGAITLFGAAQSLDCSGFLAIYLAGVIVALRGGPRAAVMTRAFAALGWMAQIGLFLGLGLLVTPHHLLPLVPAALITAAVLIFVARPVSAFLCLRPFGFGWGESAFVGWVGLRGGVPIYLALIPVLSGVPGSYGGFATAFVIVLVSLAVQGWTVGPAARLFRVVRA